MLWEKLAVSAGSDGRSFSSTIIEFGKHNLGEQDRQLLLTPVRPNFSFRHSHNLRAQDAQIGPQLVPFRNILRLQWLHAQTLTTGQMANFTLA